MGALHLLPEELECGLKIEMFKVDGRTPRKKRRIKDMPNDFTPRYRNRLPTMRRIGFKCACSIGPISSSGRRFCFTGETPKNQHELELFDFLENIEMHRRAERMPEGELVGKIVHLLRGRTRSWYQLAYRNIGTSFIDAMETKYRALPRQESERQRIYTISSNLLPKYAAHVAAWISRIAPSASKNSCAAIWKTPRPKQPPGILK